MKDKVWANIVCDAKMRPQKVIITDGDDVQVMELGRGRISAGLRIEKLKESLQKVWHPEEIIVSQILDEQ